MTVLPELLPYSIEMVRPTCLPLSPSPALLPPTLPANHQLRPGWLHTARKRASVRPSHAPLAWRDARVRATAGQAQADGHHELHQPRRREPQRGAAPPAALPLLRHAAHASAPGHRSPPWRAPNLRHSRRRVPQILELYKQYIDPEFTWSNFTVEEQAKVIVAPRSNNLLDTKRVSGGGWWGRVLQGRGSTTVGVSPSPLLCLPPSSSPNRPLSTLRCCRCFGGDGGGCWAD